MHETEVYNRETDSPRRFALAAAACVGAMRCGGEDVVAGYVIRVPRTLAKGVRRWGVSRVALLISLTGTPRTSNASATSER